MVARAKKETNRQIAPSIGQPVVAGAPRDRQDGWPDPFTFGITGPGFGDVWKSVQYAHHVRRFKRVRVRLYARWHGWPGADFSEAPYADRSELAHEIADVLAAPRGIEIVTDAPLAEVTSLLGRDPWHFPYLPTRQRWRGWTRGRALRIAYQLDGHWAGDAKNPPPEDLKELLAFAPDCDWIRLGSPSSVRQCVEAAAGCDVFFGVDSGMTQLCYAVGIPVFLIAYRQDPRVLYSWHGDKHAVHCADTADFLVKMRFFLNLVSASREAER